MVWRKMDEVSRLLITVFYFEGKQFPIINFQLFFLGQTKHNLKPCHYHIYGSLSWRHNIILSHFPSANQIKRNHKMIGVIGWNVKNLDHCVFLRTFFATFLLPKRWKEKTLSSVLNYIFTKCICSIRQLCLLYITL